MTQPFNIWDFGWPLLAVAGATAVYFLVVKPKLADAARALGKSEIVAEADGWRAWIKARFIAIKTPILALLAGLPQAFQLVNENTLYDLQQLPWGEMFDPRLANWISLGCALLIPVTHSFGMKHAAEAEPQRDE